MTTLDRRSVLRGLTGAAAATAFTDPIRAALAIEARSVTGTIQDVKHVVVLMQENRSFDHYFGTLRGVRGFSDPRAVTLSSGNSVFYQPNGNATVLPFHPSAPYMGFQFLGDLAHSWKDAHTAWNNGKNDNWVPSKGVETMAYLNRSDMPFHYALADAFTICDAYHCSIMSSTDPNRYYMWTGWVGQNGTAPGGLSVANTGTTPGQVSLSTSGNGAPPYGPVVTNAEQGYNWTTYPERLTAAGVTWKVYQDMGGPALNAADSWGWTSNPYIGNYGDNSLLYFLQYQNAPTSSQLYQDAVTGTNIQNGGAYNGDMFAPLRTDVQAGNLAQVVYIVAPQAYCEHPDFPANWGAWYVANVLSILTSNPDVWASTVLFINFDENDGFFDHVVAPTAPMSAAQGMSSVSTVNEIYPGTTSSSYQAGPYGFGARVPMLVVSPWSKGGYVCSQAFDHTSVIQFMEQRFGVMEPNITPWRRAVAGDLTSTLNFATPNVATSHLPSTSAYLQYPTTTTSSAQLQPLTQAQIASGKQPVAQYNATPPATPVVPVQESGIRLARPLPYALEAGATVNLAAMQVALSLHNTGKVGAFFHVRAAVAAVNSGGGSGPWGYTLDPATATLTDTFTATTVASYDLSVYGPNGFYRRFAGSFASAAANIGVQVTSSPAGGATVQITNAGGTATVVSVTDKYSGSTMQQPLASGGSFAIQLPLTDTYGWYDLTITSTTDASLVRHYAGHVETGADSISDPLIGPAS